MKNSRTIYVKFPSTLYFLNKGRKCQKGNQRTQLQVDLVVQGFNNK